MCETKIALIGINFCLLLFGCSEDGFVLELWLTVSQYKWEGACWICVLVGYVRNQFYNGISCASPI